MGLKEMLVVSEISRFRQGNIFTLAVPVVQVAWPLE